MSKVTKKEGPPILNLEEPSEVKSFAFPVSLCLWEVKKSAVNRCSTNKIAFIISGKVNGIVKANTNSLKTTCKYAHYWE